MGLAVAARPCAGLIFRTHLQGVADADPQRVAHLARLTGTLVAGGALPLSLLKVLTQCAQLASLLMVLGVVSVADGWCESAPA